jgi:hypothetical protein
MAFQWSNLSHKASPKKREQLKQDGLKELAEREAQQPKQTTLEEFARRLKAHGVPDQAVDAAIANMKAAGEGHE